MRNPWWGVFVGTVFTMVVQSSAAVVGMVIMLARQGIVPLSVGVSLVLGANVGTCSTALLSALGKRPATLRVALVYLFYKLVGSLAILFMLPLFSRFIASMAGDERATALLDEEALGTMEDTSRRVLLANQVPEMVASAHTWYNLLLGVLFLPFTGPVSTLMMFLVPEQSGTRSGVSPD